MESLKPRLGVPNRQTEQSTKHGKKPGVQADGNCFVLRKVALVACRKEDLV